MGVSVGFVSLLLASAGSLLRSVAGLPNPVVYDTSIAVHIRQNIADPQVEVAVVEELEDLRVKESTSRVEPADITIEVSPSAREPDKRLVVDWESVIQETVAELGTQRQNQEDIRSSMWRKSHSVMFEPGSKFIPEQELPAIPGFRFKPRVHVAGLGVTIGSCFIGLPIVGVPVEDRTVAIRLFVCAKG